MKLGIRLAKSTCSKTCYIKLEIFVKTQRNSTQLNLTQSNSKSNFVGLDIVLTWNPPPHHPTPNFSGTSRPARKLKFCTDTH